MAAALDYVDIIPRCLDEGGIFSEAEYERFDSLMKRANEWLRSHPHQRVLTCESVEMKQKTGAYVNAEKMSFFERGEQINRFIRALRLWVRPTHPQEPPEPQQLGHWNVVPVRTEDQGVFSKPKFAALPQTLDRVNAAFRQNPLAGSVLNVETQDMKCHTSLGTADPDECSWRESGKTGVYYVMVLRIFFVMGPPAYEEIGCADFVPRRIGYEKESFGSTLGQAREWVNQQHGIRFINVQSMDYKLKKDWGGESLDTHRMSYYEQPERYTWFVRIVRVSYARPFSNMPNLPPPMPNPTLNYKTFVPICLTGGGFGSPEYEGMSQTWQRAKAWINAAGSVLNVETQDMKCHSSMGTADPDECSWRESGKHGVNYVMVLRIFFVMGPPAYEEIGCADFVPRRIGHKKESFGSTLGQAREWVNQQHGIRFINVQSIDYKLKKDWGGESLDTHRMSYYEQPKYYTWYVRIVRVSYARPFSNMPELPPPMPNPTLNYKTFVPICLRGRSLGSPEFETMSQTWQRAKTWINAAGVKHFLSVETVPIRLYSGKQHGDHEITYTRNNGNRNESWFFVLRAYIDGPYQEPPREVLPPEPVEEDCCTIV